MNPSAWPNRTFVLLGALLIASSFGFAYLLIAFGWGGFQHEPLLVRVIGYGTAVAVLLAGVAAVSLGSCQSLRRRARPS